MTDTVTRADYKSVLSGGTPPTQYTRNRGTHSHFLLGRLRKLASEESNLAKLREALDLPTDAGITVAIEVSPQGALDFSAVEWVRDGIQVLSVVEGEDGLSEILTVHVPRGKLSAFEKRVSAYATTDKKPKKDGSVSPAHSALVNAISDFRLAVFDELWTDRDPPPAENELAWFQLWLRLMPAGASSTRSNFASQVTGLEIIIDPGYVIFPGRVVVAVRASRAALQQALQLLDLVAEIRSVKPTAGFFLSVLKPFEQAQWVQDLQQRSSFPSQATRSYVTLLDTGVNHGHRLLAGGIDDDDLHTIDPAWGVNDHEGHGTEMAGLSLHGDLTPHLSSDEPHEVEHRLESVKIWPPSGENASHLYGSVTAAAVGVVEHASGDRDRTFAMMTTSIGDSGGLPSEWSAQIDRLAFGINASDDGTQLPGARSPKLFVLAAGNVPVNSWETYPTSNVNHGVENPGQSWNALTVGAFTSLTYFDQAKWPDLSLISPAGSIAPASPTSLYWDPKWPLKPDVVAEGGNACMDTMLGGVTIGPEDLRLLTTSHSLAGGLLAESGDTSAAAAEVARICGLLRARYPDYWPDTQRALVVHGARWTPRMRGTTNSTSLAKFKRQLVRTYGYGAVSADRSSLSRSNEVTLVVQEHITPYVTKDSSGAKLGQIDLHSLPWPVEELLALDSQPVELRITLSYFVEPNPAQRGWQSKYRYQSHGLRFAVKGASEDLARFQQRINRLERDAIAGDVATDGAEEGEANGAKISMPDPDASGWFLGAKLRGQGSVHSDVWTGNARSLAEKSHIAVYPVGGWWKDWRGPDRQNKKTRYALVATLHVLNAATTDIYTPIANQIGITVPIEI